MTMVKTILVAPVVVVAMLASAIAGASFAVGMVFLLLELSHLPF